MKNIKTQCRRAMGDITRNSATWVNTWRAGVTFFTFLDCTLLFVEHAAYQDRTKVSLTQNMDTTDIIPAFLFLSFFSVVDVGELLQCALGHVCPRCLHRWQAFGLGPHHNHGCRPNMQRYFFFLVFSLRLFHSASSFSFLLSISLFGQWFAIFLVFSFFYSEELGLHMSELWAVQPKSDIPFSVQCFIWIVCRDLKR